MTQKSSIASFYKLCLCEITKNNIVASIYFNNQAMTWLRWKERCKDLSINIYHSYEQFISGMFEFNMHDADESDHDSDEAILKKYEKI